MSTFPLSASSSGTILVFVKTFVGTSANALQTQIWTARIALLLLKYLQLKARFGWSLSNLAALLRMNLFVYRDVWAWLDDPFTAPPGLPDSSNSRSRSRDSDSIARCRSAIVRLR